MSRLILNLRVVASSNQNNTLMNTINFSIIYAPSDLEDTDIVGSVPCSSERWSEVCGIDEEVVLASVEEGSLARSFICTYLHALWLDNLRLENYVAHLLRPNLPSQSRYNKACPLRRVRLLYASLHNKDLKLDFTTNPA